MVIGDGPGSGHRQRLRERFIDAADEGPTDESLLELLLCYAIPRRDVGPLAKALISQFGSLQAVLAASLTELRAVNGLETNSAVLLKLVDYIGATYGERTFVPGELSVALSEQPHLFDLYPNGPPAEPALMVLTNQELPKAATSVSVKPSRSLPRRPRTELFRNASLREAIELLPKLPESDSADVARAFFRENLHFNSASTRVRYAEYITNRMFPNQVADAALRRFARQFVGRPELREVCFYRFCVVETLMLNVAEDVLIPAIGAGNLSRTEVRDFLASRNPSTTDIDKCSIAVIDALTVGGLVQRERTSLTFAYRDILFASFAFVLHNEFAPGMYDVGELERNRAVRAMLWDPDRIVPSLYELRNRGILAKVSEIDRIRQFTVNRGLEEVVELLASGSGGQ